MSEGAVAMTAQTAWAGADRGTPGVDPGRSGEGNWAARISSHLAAVDALLFGELDELQRSWQLVVGTNGGRDDENDDAFAVDLAATLRQLFADGGKRTRPTMTMLGWVAADVAGDENGHDDMVRASAALEMLHCFALVHDDVMDESDTRRGKPTVHTRAARLHARNAGLGGSARFGDSIAILVGDLAHSEADRLAASLPAPMRRVWQQMVLELICGQASDVLGSAAADRRLEFARRVARQKTGYYTVARPLQLGAVAAGAGDPALAALAAYGRHAGEAFALRDDLLGVYGDPDTTGKPAGDDIRSGKPTVLLAVATQALRGAAAKALRAVGSAAMTDAQVWIVRDAMLHEGVVARLESMIDDRIADAVAALDSGELRADAVAQLSRTVHHLARRGR